LGWTWLLLFSTCILNEVVLRTKDKLGWGNRLW
jgi:hypothetical protein